MNSYIYLIQDGKYINTSIYKIGRTSQQGDTRKLNRFNGYNKHTIQKFLREVNTEQVMSIENDIKNKFKNIYKLIKGSEWFEGDCNSMILEINNIIDNNLKKVSNNLQYSIEIEDNKSDSELTSSVIENTQSIRQKINKQYNIYGTDVFLVIYNVGNKVYNFFLNWLRLNTSKWVVKVDNTNAQIIMCFFKSNKYSKVNNAVFSILNYINRHSNITYNCKNLFETRKIIKDKYLFNEYLHKYFINLENIVLDGYTKKHLNDILNISQKDIDEFNNKIKNKTDQNHKCMYCNKEFTSISTCNRHQKFNCKKNENKLSVKTKLEQIKRELKNEILNEFRNNMSKNNIKIINNNKTVNSNFQNKIEKLNCYCNDTIYMDTFIKNYENNEKYQLTKDETTLIFDNIDKFGITAYGDTLFEILKSKYYLQSKDLTQNQSKLENDVLPFVSFDVNFRSYYEKTSEGWVLVKSFDKIINILNISDKQIYNHQNKQIVYSKKGQKPICNILLRKSDYIQISKKFLEKEI